MNSLKPIKLNCGQKVKQVVDNNTVLHSEICGLNTLFLLELKNI